MLRSDYFLRQQPDVPLEQHRTAVEAIADYQLRTAKALSNLSQKLEQLRSKYRADIRGLGSADKVKEYERLHRQRVKRMSDLRRSLLLNESGQAALTEAREKAKEQSRRFIATSGIDPARIKELQQQNNEKAQAIADEHVKAIEVPAKKVDVPKRNTDYSPPYDGWYWSYYWDISSRASEPLLHHWHDESIGLAGVEAGLLLPSADDDDDLYVDHESGLSVWFKPPGTGLVQVSVDHESTYTVSSGYTKDECGNSSVTVRQRVYVTSQVVKAGYMSAVDKIDDWTTHNENKSWSDNWPYSPGGIGTTTLIVPQTVVKANEWVLVRVGVRVKNEVYANDVSVQSRLDQRYLIRKIGLTVV